MVNSLITTGPLVYSLPVFGNSTLIWMNFGKKNILTQMVIKASKKPCKGFKVNW